MQAICGAKTRAGGPCQKHPMANGRCMLHGGKSLSGINHGRYVSGDFTREALQAKKRDALLILATTALLELEEIL